MTLQIRESMSFDEAAGVLDQALGELSAERSMNALLEESLGDLELAAEDKGWRLAGMMLEQEFSREGLRQVVANCRLMAIASPMIKRGVQLRTGYVWGQGVEVQARSGSSKAEGQQDINTVLQTFLDDEANQRALTSSQAQETNERTLETDGNLVLAFFPNPYTGAVQVRTVPFEEISDKYTNPEDRDETWFFLRTYTATVIEPGYVPGTTRTRSETRRVLHPAMGYWPALRPKVIDRLPVVWDQPVLHVDVNRPAHWKWGIPDVYAALPWARAYEGFLTDWAKLVKALSKFAWKLTGDRAARTRKATDKLRTAYPAGATLPTAPDRPGLNGDAGATAAVGPGLNLEAIPKTGATIDSQSGKPLASMVASALGVSVVDLLADPGITGARAVAETLDKPVILAMGMRRALWTSVYETVCSYVIDQAVKAPRGPLKGTIARDPVTGRESITLAGDTERTVEVVWPDINELDPVQLVSAIVDADSTHKIPPPVIAKLLLHALGVDDVDEIVDELTDDDGNWIDPYANAGDQAVQGFRTGDDPAALLSGDE